MLQRIAEALKQKAQDEELTEESVNSQQRIVQQLSKSNGGSLDYSRGLIAAASSLGGQAITVPYDVREEAARCS